MLKDKIKTYRKKMNLTQEQLAEIMDVTVGAVSKWELGLSNPDIMQLPKLAKLFGVSLDVLFSLELTDPSADDLAEEIKRYSHDKEYDKGAEVALNAIRRYPNHFDILYRSAKLFMMQGIERKNKEALEKALELYHRCCPLLGQCRDESISELSIQIKIGEILVSLGRKEEAYEHLKKYNYCGINNGRIGFLLAQGKNPQQALSYLSDCLIDSFSQLLNCCIGFYNVYVAMDDYKSACEALNLMYDFAMHLRKDDQISYMDKLQAVLLSAMAQIYAISHQFEEVEKCLMKAYELAKKFDTSPDYNAQSIKFYKGKERVCGDDMGATAMDSIESIILSDGKAANILKEIWGNITNKAP